MTAFASLYLYLQRYAYNEAKQRIPLEPFNLMSEREEGFFDAQGNYVEYALTDALQSDPWLQSVDEEEVSWHY